MNLLRRTKILFTALMLAVFLSGYSINAQEVSNQIAKNDASVKTASTKNKNFN